MTPYELTYQLRRARVLPCQDGLRVEWLHAGTQLGQCCTASDEHAHMLATGWAWHGIAPRETPTLRGLQAVAP